MTEQQKQAINNEMMLAKKFNFLEPDDHEYRIMELVSDILKDSDCDNDKLEENHKNPFEEALAMFVQLDKSYYNRIKDIDYKYMIKSNLDESDYVTQIGFNGNKGFVDSILLPDSITILSKMWLSHEYVHALKETNINEFVQKNISSDTLPIFYEIILANSKFSDIYEKWKQKRMILLTINKKNYKYGKDNLANNYDLYNYIVNSYGQYLVSYFYALNLYSLFKEDPKTILKNFNAVLKHKMTTNQLVKKLDIYNINKKNINTFIYEHENL